MITDNVAEMTPEQLRDELAATKQVAQLWLHKAMKRKKELAQARSDFTDACTMRDALADEANELEESRDYNAELVEERDRTIVYVRRELKDLQGANRALARQLDDEIGNCKFWQEAAQDAEAEFDAAKQQLVRMKTTCDFWLKETQSLKMDQYHAAEEQAVIVKAAEALLSYRKRKHLMLDEACENLQTALAYKSKAAAKLLERLAKAEETQRQLAGMEAGRDYWRRECKRNNERLATLDATEAALADCGISGIYDGFDSPADAIGQMAAHARDLDVGSKNTESTLRAERQLRQKAEQRAERLYREYTGTHEALDECDIPRDHNDGSTAAGRMRIFWLNQRAEKKGHIERAEALAQLVTLPLASLLERLATFVNHRYSWYNEQCGDGDDPKNARIIAARIREALDDNQA